MRTFSFGGGRQSMAVLVLAAQQLKKDPIFFNNKAIPLQDAVEAQLDIFEVDDRTCDTGHCFV